MSVVRSAIVLRVVNTHTGPTRPVSTCVTVLRLTVPAGRDEVVAGPGSATDEPGRRPISTDTPKVGRWESGLVDRQSEDWKGEEGSPHTPSARDTGHTGSQVVVTVAGVPVVGPLVVVTVALQEG